MIGRRNKQIEFFCTGPVRKLLESDPDTLGDAEKIIRKGNSDDLTRYWWQALSRMNTDDVLQKIFTDDLIKLCDQNDSFAHAGIVQLFFFNADKKRNFTWPGPTLTRIKERSAQQYDKAEEHFNKLINATKRTRVNPTKSDAAGLQFNSIQSDWDDDDDE
jgi:hypothetical protein